MAIGVFDSGVGGLSVHRALVERFPGADFLYLADQANAPYGGLPGERIVELTRAGCQRLFDRGCDLVVLGCNTASAIALRRLQQTWLPGLRRERGRPTNILGIIVPTIEAATGLPWTQEPEYPPEKAEALETLGVFCTAQTAASRVYEIEIHKRRGDLAVFVEPCPELARLIEMGAEADILKAVIESHVRELARRVGRMPDRFILGCTHYELAGDLFRQVLPEGAALIHQPEATADALARYLATHPDYEPGASGLRRFLTTGAAGPQNGLVEAFWGAPLAFEAA
ncbi:MAG TPA: glutamate racemase [Caulobacteraceae bacterium]|nr:glutamate racemase [Caulobacteraceae bacterium]